MAAIGAIATMLKSGDHVVVMSNGGFGGMPQRILDELTRREHWAGTGETA